jgi:hypothetical protein
MRILWMYTNIYLFSVVHRHLWQTSRLLECTARPDSVLIQHSEVVHIPISLVSIVFVQAKLAERLPLTCGGSFTGHWCHGELTADVLQRPKDAAINRPACIHSWDEVGSRVHTADVTMQCRSIDWQNFLLTSETTKTPICNEYASHVFGWEQVGFVLS